MNGENPLIVHVWLSTQTVQLISCLLLFLLTRITNERIGAGGVRLGYTDTTTVEPLSADIATHIKPAKQYKLIKYDLKQINTRVIIQKNTTLSIQCT